MQNQGQINALHERFKHAHAELEHERDNSHEKERQLEEAYNREHVL